MLCAPVCTNQGPVPGEAIRAGMDGTCRAKALQLEWRWFRRLPQGKLCAAMHDLPLTTMQPNVNCTALQSKSLLSVAHVTLTVQGPRPAHLYRCCTSLS